MRQATWRRLFLGKVCPLVAAIIPAPGAFPTALWQECQFLNQMASVFEPKDLGVVNEGIEPRPVLLWSLYWGLTVPTSGVWSHVSSETGSSTIP